MNKKQWLRGGVALVIALSVSPYFPFAPWATLFAVLTPVGLKARFNLQRFLLAALILVILVAVVYPKIVFDIILGLSIGLVANLFILPVRADVEFRHKIIPILIIFKDYLTSIVEALLDKKMLHNTDEQKLKLERLWQDFPDWVYEVGFAPHLQQGHRHFLIRIDQVRQILFILQYLARFHYDEDLIKHLKSSLENYVTCVKTLIEAETTVLNLVKLPEGVEGLAESFDALDNEFKRLVPYSIEAIEINKEYIYLADFIYNLGELGNMLLILARALR